MRGLGGSIKEFKKGMDEGNPYQNKHDSAAAPEGAISREHKDPSDSTAVEKK